MALYLVTGGAGFIGSHLVEELVRRGEEVRVLDNFSSGYLENVKPFMNHIEVIEGDILNRKIVQEATKGVDYVLHQAAVLPGSSASYDPLAIYQVNVGGTINVLFASYEAGVKRVVYASSFLVYGISSELPKRENMEPRPKCPYAESKLSGEQACQAFSYGYGLVTICLRYFSVFGQRQSITSPYAGEISYFFENIMKEKPLVIPGNGEQSRDYTFVTNVVEANLLCTQKKSIVSGRVYNVGSGHNYSLNQISAFLYDILKKKRDIKYTRENSEELQHSQADIGRAQAALGYRPVIQTFEGLERLVAWHQEKRTRRNLC